MFVVPCIFQSMDTGASRGSATCKDMDAARHKPLKAAGIVWTDRIEYPKSPYFIVIICFVHFVEVAHIEFFPQFSDLCNRQVLTHRCVKS